MISNVGMATGWYLNRHVSFEYPSFDSAVQCEPENEEERRYYERVFAFFQDIAFSGILPPGSKIPGCGFSIAPQRIRSSKEPLEMACAGYGCIMLKKEVNDRFSHLSIHDGYIWTEDLTVCIGARKAGHKLMVDPTCYCEHLG